MFMEFRDCKSHKQSDESSCKCWILWDHLSYKLGAILGCNDMQKNSFKIKLLNTTQSKTQIDKSVARNSYPAWHGCKQLISNSIDMELIANSIQTRGVMLSLALLPERPVHIFGQKKEEEQGDTEVRNLHKFTSASEKNYSNTVCV